MTSLEMRVEALIRCVDPVAYEQALRELRWKDEPVDADVPRKSYEAEVRSIARELLGTLGMPSHILGYQHTTTAVFLIVTHPEYARAMTKELYPEIAKIHGTEASRVSRAIRHAVECVWDRGDLEVLDRYWGNSVKRYTGRPTNSEFLTKCAELVRDRLE